MAGDKGLFVNRYERIRNPNIQKFAYSSWVKNRGPQGSSNWWIWILLIVGAFIVIYLFYPNLLSFK